MPACEFSKESFFSSSSTSSRVKRTAKCLLKALCELKCLDDVPSMANSFQAAAFELSDLTNIPIYRDLSICSLSKSNQVSKISKAILSSHVSLSGMQELLRAAAMKLSGLSANDYTTPVDSADTLQQFEQFMKRKAAVNETGFSSCRRTFKHIIEGNSLGESKYKCRISMCNINKAIEFLRNSLPEKVGRERPVWIGPQLFQKLPVFDRQSYSLEKIFQLYQKGCTEAFRVGISIFREFVRYLTTRGTMRAGLSTYYIDFRYCQKMTLQMIDQLDLLLAKVSPELRASINKNHNLSSFRERWNSLSDFLKFIYIQVHIQLSSSIKSHCSRFILCLNDIFEPEYDQHGCAKCDEIITLPNHFRSYISSLSQLPLRFDDLSELKSMKNPCDIIENELTRYAGHQVRGKAQDLAIK